MAVTLDLVLLQIFTGIALGSVFVLLAVGLSLIFGLLTVVNFAHGAFYMVGAYVGVFLLGYGVNFWTALVLAPLLVGTIGLGVERFLIRPLYGRGIDYPLLSRSDLPMSWSRWCGSPSGATACRSIRRRRCKAPSTSGSDSFRSTGFS
jgi:hypothetical protein